MSQDNKRPYMTNSYDNNIILHGQNQKSYSTKIRNKPRISTIAILNIIVLEVLAEQLDKKRNKRHPKLKSKK